MTSTARLQREADANRVELADTLGQLRDGLATLADQTRQSLAHLLEEQPILMAALSAALGAALGAALPLSKAEKDMIGSAGARVVGAGRDAVTTAADALKAEASNADIGAKVGEIADKVVQSVSKNIHQATAS